MSGPFRPSEAFDEPSDPATIGAHGLGNGHDVIRLRTAVLLLAIGVLALPALARGPADSFRRTIRLFMRTPPASFESDDQATNWYRTFSVDRVRRAEDGTWTLDAVVFLAEPLRDFEVQLVFYDVSDGPRRFIRTTTAMVGNRDARVVKKHLVLRQPEFNPQRYYEIVATRQRREVTRPLRFWLGGAIDRGPRDVTFTDEEAAAGPPDLGF